MAWIKQRWWLAVAAGILIVIALVYWFVFGGNSMPVLKKITPFTLINTQEEEVTIDGQGERIRLVSFIYIHCPDICPLTTIQMKQMQDVLKEEGLFGEKIEFVSITMDPKRDTPQALRDYAEVHGADLNGWQFLTGSEETITPILEEFGFYAEEMDNGIYLHSTKTYLLDAKNRLRAIYGMGNEMEKEKMIEDMKSLIE